MPIVSRTPTTPAFAVSVAAVAALLYTATPAAAQPAPVADLTVPRLAPDGPPIQIRVYVEPLAPDGPPIRVLIGSDPTNPQD